jgi:hypothetical protein
MSASKDIKKYSDNWAILFERFNDHPEENYVVHCDSLKEAQKVRLEWYKARKAQEAWEATLSPQDSEYKLPNLARKEVVIFGTDVHFRFKEDSDVATLLGRSFEQNKKDEK